MAAGERSMMVRTNTQDVGARVMRASRVTTAIQVGRCKLTLSNPR